MKKKVNLGLLWFIENPSVTNERDNSKNKNVIKNICIILNFTKSRGYQQLINNFYSKIKRMIKTKMILWGNSRILASPNLKMNQLMASQNPNFD